MHEIIEMGLVDRDFIAKRTSNYGELAKLVKQYPPERAGQICGISPAVLREVARPGERPARRSSTGGWASPSTPPAPTTLAA